MSTTPPPPPPPEEPAGMGQGTGPPSYTAMGNFSIARMPTPGNAEFLYVVLALILVAIIAAIADSITVGSWMQYFTVVSFAYIVSRGIAKASRVLEQ